MHITWLGQTAIKIQTKHIDEDITTLIDPYRPKNGEFPRSLSAHIALFSKGSDGATTLTSDPFCIDTLGEFDTKGLFINGLAGPDGITMFKISVEGITLVHTGALRQKLSDEAIGSLGKIDVLLIPVGGNDLYLSPADAAHLVTALEPRIIIPIGHACDSDQTVQTIESFIKELGIKPEITDKKVIIKAKDLPADETKLYILEKVA